MNLLFNLERHDLSRSKHQVYIVLVDIQIRLLSFERIRAYIQSALTFSSPTTFLTLDFKLRDVSFPWPAIEFIKIT